MDNSDLHVAAESHSQLTICVTFEPFGCACTLENTDHHCLDQQLQVSIAHVHSTPFSKVSHLQCFVLVTIVIRCTCHSLQSCWRYVKARHVYLSSGKPHIQNRFISPLCYELLSTLPNSRPRTSRSSMASALSLADKTFIVTGANSGLGFETAKALARQDAHVIFAVKTKAKGDDAIRHVQEVATKRAKLECMQVDLASFRYSQLRVVLIRPEAGAYALVHVCSFP